MKTIYRVEHYNRRHGPYRASSDKMNNRCLKLADKLHDEFSVAQQPPPCYDGICNHGSDDYCGFNSLDDLFKWFEQWLEELQEHDYHVAVFEVKDKHVRHGDKQVMFKRKKYRRKKTIRLDEVKDETKRCFEAVA
jgi:hypothetical protein